MTDFTLHARLAADSTPVGRLPLSLVRLAGDARYPWVVLVPERDAIRELHELSPADRAALIEEAAAVSAAMQRVFGADKMNVATLGNMVPQLHVHCIAREEGDAAWPGAVWGAHPPTAYDAAALSARLAELRAAFAAIDGFIPSASSAE